MNGRRVPIATLPAVEAVQTIDATEVEPGHVLEDRRAAGEGRVRRHRNTSPQPVGQAARSSGHEHAARHPFATSPGSAQRAAHVVGAFPTTADHYDC